MEGVRVWEGGGGGGERGSATLRLAAFAPPKPPTASLRPRPTAHPPSQPNPARVALTRPISGHMIPSHPARSFLFVCHPCIAPKYDPAMRSCEGPGAAGQQCLWSQSPPDTAESESCGALAPRAALRCLLGPAQLVLVASAPARLAFPLLWRTRARFVQPRVS